MSILALARVYNSEEVAVSKGWKTGYRLMDTSDKSVSDVDEQVVKSEIIQKKVKIDNLAWVERLNTLVELFASENNKWLHFPEIMVNSWGEEAAKQEKDIRLLYVIGVDKNGRVVTTCDVFGKNMQVHAMWEVLREFLDNKLIVMNHLDMIDGDIAEIRDLRDEIFNGIHVEADGFLGACEESYINPGLVSKEVQEYNARAKLINIPTIYACKSLIRDGITLASVECGNRVDIRTIVVPNFITAIAKFSFRGCEGIQSIVLGTGVRTLGSRAFVCGELIRLELNEGLEELGEQAFTGTVLHGELEIPESVKRINEFAFDTFGCKRLVIKAGMLKPDKAELVWIHNMPYNLEKLELSEDAAAKILGILGPEYVRVPAEDMMATGNKLRITYNEAERILSRMVKVGRRKLKYGVEIIKE